ncbi:MAG: InlB B-repeat-containing protein, partial [Clostridia bacterium]|nr:InlB B-repeat-containing protein [Clostridia bacterium]
MKKRLLSILLTLLMILGVMPLSVSADTPFTITLHANDSSGATVTSELSSGSIYTVPDDAFTNGKYAIQYWNTQPDNSGFIYYNDEDFTVTENLDLYAQWVLPLAKEEAFEQDGISWSGNGASPFKLTMSDGAVIISSVIFPTDSSNPGIDEIIIEAEGDCEIAGNIGVASNDDLSYAYERANIIITGDGTLKTGIKGTGHGDTLTIDADTEITGGISIGASGGMDSNLIIKSGKTLTVEEDISLIESLTLESGAKLIVGSNISFHSNPTISLADDAEIHITAENNYMESCVLYKEMGDNSYFEYLEENNWLPKDYYFVDGYLYNDSDEIETEGVIIKKRLNESTIYFEDIDIEPITLPHGATVSAPDDPEKEGHTFLGWDKEIPATMPTEDMTITALWEVNQYTIAFENTGDSVIDDITQDYGTQIAHPADPVKAGYIFTGWDVQIPSTMPAENMTITATWQEKPLPSVNTDRQTYIYNGSAHEFTVRGDNFTVTYSQNGNPVENPTDAGVYDVSITRPEDEGYAAYEKELTGALVIKSAVITDVEGVSAPEATKTADSTVLGVHYSGSAQWTPTDSVFDYNTVYSVVIKLTADKNYVFEDGISLDGYEANVTDDGKTLTLTATFEKTAKEKITSITPPSVDKLGAYYDDASDAIASLPPTVEAQAESGKTTLDITWNIIGTYNPAPGAQNSFSWTADIGE